MYDKLPSFEKIKIDKLDKYHKTRILYIILEK